MSEPQYNYRDMCDKEYLKMLFWQNHLNWFTPFISELYPLTNLQFLQYEDILDWNRVKVNPFIKWTKDSKSYFKDRLDNCDTIEHFIEMCYGDSVLPKYPCAEEIYFREEEITNSRGVFWGNITFGIHDISLAMADQIRFNLTQKFGCTRLLSYGIHAESPLSGEYLMNNKQNLNWELLSRYWDLDWSFELIQQFEQYWVTEQLILNHSIFNYCLKDDLSDEFIESVLNEL